MEREWGHSLQQRHTQLSSLPVSSAGGRVEEIPLDGPVDDPQWLPDGRHFLYLSGRATEAGTLMATSIDRGAPRVAVREFEDSQDAGARFSNAGFLLFNRGGVLNRQRLDTTALKLVGPLMAIGDKAGRPRGWLAASVAGPTIVALNPPPDEMGGTPGILFHGFNGSIVRAASSAKSAGPPATGR